MAGSIPRSFIDDLLAKTDIVDVINSRVKLKKKGREYEACCPFHHEKTPSFTVSPKKQFYYCFGCHAKGNAITFLMEYDKLDFVESIEELANSLGLDVPYEKSNFSAREPSIQGQQKRDLYAFMQHIAEYYAKLLPQDAQATQYLLNRGLSSEIIQRFQIGYAPQGFQNLSQYFGAKPEIQQQLLQLGMLTQNDRGDVYDRFRQRIMFPIRDRRGRTIAFGGRVLNDEKPKYLNSPETVTYHKGNELYGLYEATQQKDELEKILVVEGYMDVVALAQYGVDYAVASLGTATTPEQLKLAFRATEQIVCCYDADRAGRQAAWRALENVLPLLEDGRQIKFIFLPDGEDPDSFIRKQGKEAFESYLNDAQSFSDFFFAHLKPQVDFSSEEGKLKLITLAMPLITQIPGEGLRNTLLTTLQSLLGIWDRSFLQNLYQQQSKPQASKAPLKVRFTPMRMLIALLLQEPTLVKEIPLTEGELYLPPEEEFQEPGYALFAQIARLCFEQVGVNTGQILEHWRDTKELAALEKLALWDHLVQEKDYAKTFKDNLIFLYDKYIAQRIAILIAKDRANGLEEQEKLELAQLIQLKPKYK